jgi:hypothetical protein
MRFPERRGFVSVVLAVLLAVSSAPAAATGVPVVERTSTASGAPAPCTTTLGPDATVVDGATRDDLQPGSVVCLPAGFRGNLRIANVHGTAEAPITFRNDGGTVVITGADFQGGIEIRTSSHLRITGSGAGEQCGAPADGAGQECGIVLDGPRKGVIVLTRHGEVTGFEFDHLAIRNLSGENTRGITIHPVPGQVVSDVRVHHNWISTTGAEAVYIGSEPRSDRLDELGQVDRVDVSHNLIEQIQWDGIKVKVARSESRITRNVIRDVGLARYARHESGITVTMSNIEVSYNAIARAPEGIKSGRALPDAENTYANNVVNDVDTLGIQTVEEHAHIVNNTIARSGGYGIRARGSQSVVAENIIADAEDPLVVRGSAVVRANLVGSASEVGFRAADDGDFGLLATSPAIEAGRIARIELCAMPGLKALRPIGFAVNAAERDKPTGCRSDLGAIGYPDQS